MINYEYFYFYTSRGYNLIDVLFFHSVVCGCVCVLNVMRKWINGIHIYQCKVLYFRMQVLTHVHTNIENSEGVVSLYKLSGLEYSGSTCSLQTHIHFVINLKTFDKIKRQNKKIYLKYIKAKILICKSHFTTLFASLWDSEKTYFGVEIAENLCSICIGTFSLCWY